MGGNWFDKVPGVVIGLMVLWFAWDMRPLEPGTYRKPVVTGARVINGVGELDVESSHSEHVVREMNLPVGSNIRIVQRNEKYLVTFDTPCKQTPDVFEVDVFDRSGRPYRDVIAYTQRDADRDYVKVVAQANGYEGKIEER